MSAPLTVHFLGGAEGAWRVTGIRALRGAPLPEAPRLTVHEGLAPPPPATWALRAVTSHIRYTRRAEVEALAARQEGLGRPRATEAALIPIRKTPAWWGMAQDERRAILEEQSRHIAIGLEYLPGVARRLHHARDLGEPFDFLTWFEFPPADAPRFDELLRRLRATPEWDHVEREVEIRLTRDAA